MEHKVLYLCDNRHCENCRGDVCDHTGDITHAQNFVAREGIYIEKPRRVSSKEIVRRTAKEICSLLDCVPTSDVNELNHLALLKKHIAEKYGVEI